MTINTTMAEPCDKCGKLDANACEICNAVHFEKSASLPDAKVNDLGLNAGLMEKVGRAVFARELSATEMRAAIRELLRLAQKDVPIASVPEGDPALRAIMERDAWRNAMIGLCNGKEWHTTPDAAAAHLRGRLHPEKEAARVVEMALCTAEQVFLKPNQLYRFYVKEGCDKCARLATNQNA